MTAPIIDHIGIVVADLEQALARLRPLFGEGVAIRELPEVGLRVAELQAANVVVELLQYTGESASQSRGGGSLRADRTSPRRDGESQRGAGSSAFARRVMGERLGINHLSIRVDDVDRAIGALGGSGFAPMPGFPRQGAHGRVAFFEPDSVTGLLFEVCAPDPGKDPESR